MTLVDLEIGVAKLQGGRDSQMDRFDVSHHYFDSQDYSLFIIYGIYIYYYYYHLLLLLLLLSSLLSLLFSLFYHHYLTYDSLNLSIQINC